MGGNSLVTAAGPCRIHTGFPILPERGTSLQSPPRTLSPIHPLRQSPLDASLAARPTASRAPLL
ncbi:hypothetical protein GCM10009560_59270 [Nonomuraea longicatena]|uniref:Uncharacterized protein n=1 Tax=Nonomuraea longicatena TaxID=83682 RepID=A0ABN1QMQ4_9ACTN